MPEAKADGKKSKESETPEAESPQSDTQPRATPVPRELNRAELEALRLRLFKKFHGRVA